MTSPPTQRFLFSKHGGAGYHGQNCAVCGKGLSWMQAKAKWKPKTGNIWWCEWCINEYGKRWMTPEPLTITFTSFSYKKGKPNLPSNYIIDVRRRVRNPYGVPELRGLTFKDEPVRRFLARCSGSMNTVWSVPNRLNQCIQLSNGLLAIGCTGGRHRSPYIAEQSAEYFNKNFHHVYDYLQNKWVEARATVVHRDL